mgnify:CR=1 FL=1
MIGAFPILLAGLFLSGLLFADFQFDNQILFSDVELLLRIGFVGIVFSVILGIIGIFLKFLYGKIFSNILMISGLIGIFIFMFIGGIGFFQTAMNFSNVYTKSEKFELESQNIHIDNFNIFGSQNNFIT